jgi:hypothetical protein
VVPDELAFERYDDTCGGLLLERFPRSALGGRGRWTYVRRRAVKSIGSPRHAVRPLPASLLTEAPTHDAQDVAGRGARCQSRSRAIPSCSTSSSLRYGPGVWAGPGQPDPVKPYWATYPFLRQPTQRRSDHRAGETD